MTLCALKARSRTTRANSQPVPQDGAPERNTLDQARFPSYTPPVWSRILPFRTARVLCAFNKE
jgi:hypothetical protein